ncbi:MAG: sarcosine oxidase subunit gamma [Woeseia sp.]
MTESQLRRHGLESFLASVPNDAGSNPGVTIEVLPPLGHLNLRGDPKNEGFLTAAADVLGETLPLAANTMSHGVRRIYWLGPDEWLIVTVVEETVGLLVQFRSSLSGQHASVTDVSGGQVALRLAGPYARNVLAKGCTLDFHRDRFETGDCAQTGLAKATVLIGLLDSEPTYEIIVRRTFADYLARWLRRASREYSVNFSAA